MESGSRSQESAEVGQRFVFKISRPRTFNYDYPDFMSNQCGNLESDSREKLSRVFEPDACGGGDNTLDMLNQKNVELSNLFYRISLLENLTLKQQDGSDERTNSQPGSQDVGLNSCTLASEQESGEGSDEYRLGKMEENMKENFQNPRHVSVITPEEEQSTCLRIIGELSGIANKLKQQKEIKEKKIEELHRIVSHPPAKAANISNIIDFEHQHDNAIEKNTEINSSVEWNKGIESNTTWHSMQPNPRNLNGSKTPTTNGGNVRTQQSLRTYSDKNYFYKDMKLEVKNINSKLREQDTLMARTITSQKELHEQWKLLISVVESLKNEQQKDKYLMNCFFEKLEETFKSEKFQFSSSSLRNLDKRISSVERSLKESKSQSSEYKKEINDLRKELTQSRVLIDELKTLNLISKKEFAEVSAKNLEDRNKILELIEAIEEEKMQNNMKKSFEEKLQNHASNMVMDLKQNAIENKTDLEAKIKCLQSENGDLKQKILQVEDECKAVSYELKNKCLNSKKSINGKISSAVLKLQTADKKIKEFFNTIQKFLRTLHQCMYKKKINKIRRKCLEEEGVRDATSILGVTSSEMTKVLASSVIPNVNDWLHICKKFVFKEKFSDELASFLISLVSPIINKDSY